MVAAIFHEKRVAVESPFRGSPWRGILTYPIVRRPRRQGRSSVPLVRYTTSGATTPKLGLIDGDSVIDVAAAGGPTSLKAALQLPAAHLVSQLAAVRKSGGQRELLGLVSLAPPVDEQEVWASGVTYLRSRDARMEESTQKDVYDIVYEADRPELFFKATPGRVVGPDQDIAIRGDSTWDVPEPELALVINAHGEVIGYTVGNDMSSRSIEGENPLYLPQAKMYTKCAGLGPVIALADEVPDPRNLAITLVIERDGAVNFEESTSTSQIHRTFEDLVMYLHRHNTFPNGVILCTGTGIIPPPEFTLEDGDVVSITIDAVGTLRNPVIRL
jgi:2-dehydro-3-deoxy-D-arabinonate dehydratase